MKRVLDGKLMILVHDDGPCQNGKMHTPLTDEGLCPVCNFHPDTQSKCFVPAPEENVSAPSKKQRPPCPFYGFVGFGNVMMDNDGNACGLASGHSPCKLEMKNQEPNWKHCTYFNRETNEQALAQILKHATIFPSELRPPNVNEWHGVSLSGWFHLVLAKK